MVVEKLPEILATKWAMEVQRHELNGRPNLFYLDRWMSDQDVCRQHLVQKESSTKYATTPKPHKPRRDYKLHLIASTLASTLATSLNHNSVSKQQGSSLPTCPCCGQSHALSLSKELYLCIVKSFAKRLCALIV
jgi:hypothetical protein